MRQETFVVDTPDGVALHCYAWLPDGEPTAIVQVSHGMAEHAGRYEELARALTQAGFAVVADDHRGHGHTRSEARGHMADRHGWDKVVNDLLRVTTAARERVGDVPLFLLGHSWGSLLARDYAMRWGHQLSGLVVMGTAGDAGAFGRVGQVVARIVALRGRRRPSRLLDRLTFGSYNKHFAPNRTRFDWLSSLPDEVDAYVADPDCGFVCSAQFFADLAGGVARVNDASNVALVPRELPVLVVAGADDAVGDFGKGPRQVAAQLREAGVAVETVICPQVRHEVLHDDTADEVTSGIVAWLRARATTSEQEMT